MFARPQIPHSIDCLVLFSSPDSQIIAVHLPIRPTCCFLIAIATFNLRPFSTRLSPSRRTRFASSSVSKVMNPYLEQRGGITGHKNCTELDREYER